MISVAFLACLLATALLAALTLAPMCRFEAWWIRAMDFPRFQLSIMLLALLMIEWMLLDFDYIAPWCLVFVGLICLVYQAWWIVPFSRLHKKEVSDAQRTPNLDTIRVMTANVFTPNRRADLLLDHVRKHAPDVLVTLESDAWWQEQLDQLIDQYPHTIKCPLDNTYGMHVYSRFELINPCIDYLVEDDVPSMHTLVAHPSGRNIQCHFLHPAPPSPTENQTSKERDAELIAVAKRVADTTIPVIVTGDLNDVAWSDTTRLFRKISGLLDPRIGRGLLNTFHAHYWFVRWPLDHIFHSGHFSLCDIRRLPAFGSDHFALFSELAINRSGDVQTNGLETTEDDEALADEKLSHTNVDADSVPDPSKNP